MRIGTIWCHERLRSNSYVGWTEPRLLTSCVMWQGSFLWDSVSSFGNENDNSYLTGYCEGQIKTHGWEVPSLVLIMGVDITSAHKPRLYAFSRTDLRDSFWRSLILLAIWPRTSETIPYVLFCVSLLLNMLMLVQERVSIEKLITVATRNPYARHSC